MGLQIREIIPATEISLESLKGRTLAIDTFNMLYQFLTTIRQKDGSPLSDSKGRVTSHLVGLHSRTTNFMQAGIKPIFVFDGKPPELKKLENERRAAAKREAMDKYAAAKDGEDIDGMKKYASRSARLDSGMIAEAKELIAALGCPIVQAPSEGEAQAAHIVNKGDAYAVVSQDFDSLLYAAPILIRNLSVAGRRKIPGKPVYQTISPERILIKDTLAELSLSQDQLIALALLVGTDFNIGGIKGIGPKKALQLARTDDFDRLFQDVKWEQSFPHRWQDVYDVFKSMPVTDDYHISFRPPDRKRLVQFLCGEHEFSEDRVNSSLQGLEKRQTGLGDFF